MRAFARALLFLWRPILVAYCFRRQDLLAAPSEVASPEKEKRKPPWHWLKRLPLLVGARLGAGHGSRGRAFEALASGAALGVRGASGSEDGQADEHAFAWEAHTFAWDAKGDAYGDVAEHAFAMQHVGDSEDSQTDEHAFAWEAHAFAWDAVGDAYGDVAERGFAMQHVGDPQEESISEARHTLLSGVWATRVAQAPHQLWRFRFFAFPHSQRLYAEISYFHFGDAARTLGTQIVQVSPTVWGGRFRGFEGIDGQFVYRFGVINNAVAGDAALRIDIGTPSSGIVEYNFRLVAIPIPVRAEVIATTPPAVPSDESREQFLRNLERVVWPMLPQARELLDLVERGGHWRGSAKFDDEGYPLRWRFDFRGSWKKFRVSVETKGDSGVWTHAVVVEPRFAGDDFKGLSGEHLDSVGLRTEFHFAAESGNLLVQIVYDMDHRVKDLVLKANVGLVHVPEEFMPEEFVPEAS